MFFQYLLTTLLIIAVLWLAFRYLKKQGIIKIVDKPTKRKALSNITEKGKNHESNNS